MIRKALTFLLLLSVCWQALAVAGFAAALTSAEASSHVLQHWQEADHHHHEDGTQHADEAAGNVQHMHAESMANAAGPVAAGWRDALALRPAAPDMLVGSAHIAPYLQQPLRPPQSLA